ncbi:hypothetical protein ABPG72_016866 [Tetrahymena utriculariae]
MKVIKKFNFFFLNLFSSIKENEHCEREPCWELFYLSQLLLSRYLIQQTCLISMQTIILNLKFRSQTFTTDDDINIPLVNELVALQYITKKNSTFDNLDQIEQKIYKAYIVYVPIYVYQVNSKAVYRQVLDLVPCQNPQLQGNKCVDLSKLPSNSTFCSSVKNKITTAITILASKCQYIDNYKTTIPCNCANPSEIDNFINNSNNNLYTFLQTSYYNITSNKVQVNYSRYPLILTTSQILYTLYYAQKQITSVLSGAILQSEFSFCSAITYTTSFLTFDQEAVKKEITSQILYRSFCITIEFCVIYKNLIYNYPRVASYVQQYFCSTDVTRILRKICFSITCETRPISTNFKEYVLRIL